MPLNEERPAAFENFGVRRSSHGVGDVLCLMCPHRCEPVQHGRAARPGRSSWRLPRSTKSSPPSTRMPSGFKATKPTTLRSTSPARWESPRCAATSLPSDPAACGCRHPPPSPVPKSTSARTTSCSGSGCAATSRRRSISRGTRRFAGSAAQQLMPIEPQWLLDALGLAEFKPTDRHEGPLPIDKNRVEIKSYVQSASGPLVKHTVIDAHKAWVLEQHLYDGAGKLLASAVAKSHRFYPETGVSLPQTIEIQIPPADLAMTIDVGTVELNRLAANPQLWALPTIQGRRRWIWEVRRQQIRAEAYRQWAAKSPAPIGTTRRRLTERRACWRWRRLPRLWRQTAPPCRWGQAALSPRAPAPQFVPPGGVAMPTSDPLATPAPAPPNAQRLPAGGVAAQPPLTR